MQSYFGSLSGNSGSLDLLVDSHVVDNADRSMQISQSLSQIGLRNSSTGSHQHDHNIALSSHHEMFPDGEDLFQCGKCKQQFTALQAFIQHKQEECVGRLQSLHCQGQNMSHLQHQSHMQNQMSHQQNRTSMTGSGVIFNQTQELVSQGQQSQSLMLNTVQMANSRLENQNGLNLTQETSKTHVVPSPLRNSLNTISLLTCEPTQNSIPINQVDTLVQYQSAESAVMHGNVGNTEQDMNNMVLSEDILLNANSPNDEYVTDSQMERLHPSEVTSQQFGSIGVGITHTGMPSFLQQIPPLQNNMMQQQQTSTSLHESHQMLMQMQQPNMHHPQSSAMQQKNMNNVPNCSLGLNFSTVTLAPYSTPSSSYIGQEEQNNMIAQNKENEMNLSKLPSIAPRPESTFVMEQSTLNSNDNSCNEPTIIDSQDSTSVRPKSKKKFSCQFCSKAFSRTFDLEQHVRSHTGEKPFQCIVCGRAFSQKSNVKKHMATHKVWPKSAPSPLSDIVMLQESSKEKEKEDSDHEEDTLEKKETNVKQKGKASAAFFSDAMALVTRFHSCPYCFKILTSYKERKSHMILHKDKQVYKCLMEGCDQTFPDLDSFVEHVKVHEGNMTYRCHHCHNLYNSLHDLGVHQYQAHLNAKSKAGKLYACSLCPGKFSHPEALRKHMSTETHFHPCTFCDKKFSCDRYLRKHVDLMHSQTPRKIIKCEVCDQTVSSIYYLQSHMLIHTKEKPFKCLQCKSAFNRKDKLKRHMLIHDPVKKWKCPLRDVLGCDKEFSRPDKLKAHIIRHGGVKHHQCSYCSKIYSRKSFKVAHERTHTDEFRCLQCKRGFNSGQRLAQHKCKPTPQKKSNQASSSTLKTKHARSLSKKGARPEEGGTQTRPKKKLAVQPLSKLPSGNTSDSTVITHPAVLSVPIEEGPTMYAIRSGSTRKRCGHARSVVKLALRDGMIIQRKTAVRRRKLTMPSKQTRRTKSSMKDDADKINIEIEVQDQPVAEDSANSEDIDIVVDDSEDDDRPNVDSSVLALDKSNA